MFQILLDLLFPRYSLTGKPGAFITEDEWQSIPLSLHREDVHALRSRDLTALDCLCSAVDYNSSKMLQRALHTLKYKRIPLVVHKLADLLLDASELKRSEDSILCPVPLHWKRQCERGFNQSAMLAKNISVAVDLPVFHLLQRTRDTGHQAWRKREDRLNALRGAFSVSHGKYVPAHVTLIDDIATTGATLDACAHALKNAGAVTVDAWVIARS